MTSTHHNIIFKNNPTTTINPTKSTRKSHKLQAEKQECKQDTYLSNPPQTAGNYKGIKAINAYLVRASTQCLKN